MYATHPNTPTLKKARNKDFLSFKPLWHPNPYRALSLSRPPPAVKSNEAWRQGSKGEKDRKEGSKRSLRSDGIGKKKDRMGKGEDSIFSEHPDFTGKKKSYGPARPHA
jgi:hypothetical protein